jgi:hypothetical protein
MTADHRRQTTAKDQRPKKKQKRMIEISNEKNEKAVNLMVLLSCGLWSVVCGQLFSIQREIKKGDPVKRVPFFQTQSNCFYGVVYPATR